MIGVPAPPNLKLFDLTNLPRPERSGVLAIGILYLLTTILNGILLAPYLVDGPITLSSVACMVVPCGLLWPPARVAEKYQVTSLITSFDLYRMEGSGSAGDEPMYTCIGWDRFDGTKKVFINGPYTDIPKHMIGGLIFIHLPESHWQVVDTRVLDRWHTYEYIQGYHLTHCRKQGADRETR